MAEVEKVAGLAAAVMVEEERVVVVTEAATEAVETAAAQEEVLVGEAVKVAGAMAGVKVVDCNL